MQRKIRVLIVDDSAIVRKILSEALSAEDDIEVVGTAPDPYVARDKILALSPDVITLDIEMPRMDGLSFLKKLMQYRPTPTVMISSLAQSSCSVVLEAMECGAVEVLAKPGSAYSVGELRLVLANKVRAAAVAKVKATEPSPKDSPAPPVQSLKKLNHRGMIVIGASTGGTEAVREILQEMPANSPPILVVQHIPQGFSRAFAERLDRLCAIRVKEAADGDEVSSGQALIAPGDFHMMLQNGSEPRRVSIKTGPRICYQRPAVDVLFQSVAAGAAKDAVGVLLTGMGSDGAQGMLKMKQAGARTIAQDESTCVVYGMPREAVRLGAVDQILRLQDIAPALCRLTL
jgi:two-component system, chemotaxis family, protein-glutamate methylesterase/glutaminase